MDIFENKNTFYSIVCLFLFLFTITVFFFFLEKGFDHAYISMPSQVQHVINCNDKCVLRGKEKKNRTVYVDKIIQNLCIKQFSLHSFSQLT